MADPEESRSWPWALGVGVALLLAVIWVLLWARPVALAARLLVLRHPAE